MRSCMEKLPKKCFQDIIEGGLSKLQAPWMRYSESWGSRSRYPRIRSTSSCGFGNHARYHLLEAIDAAGGGGNEPESWIEQHRLQSGCPRSEKIIRVVVPDEQDGPRLERAGRAQMAK